MSFTSALTSYAIAMVLGGLVTCSECTGPSRLNHDEKRHSGPPNALKVLAALLSSLSPTVAYHPLATRPIATNHLYRDLARSSQPPRMAATETAGSPVMQEVTKKIDGKTAIVTGSSQGSGKATAMSLAKRGWNVVLIARQPERLAAATAEVLDAGISSRKERVLGVPCDISSEESVQGLSAKVLARYASVDLLVNNAGICQTASFDGTSMDDFERLMQTNFMGAVRVTKQFLPALKSSKGTIVNVNSFGGVIPLNGLTAYTASKFALAGWSESMRAELKPFGVHVGQVHPGVINSDFLERASFELEDGAERMRKTLDSAPFVQTPEEIAEAVLDAYTESKSEVVVGRFFQTAVAAYRFTGANPFALQNPNART